MRSFLVALAVQKLVGAGEAKIDFCMDINNSALLSINRNIFLCAHSPLTWQQKAHKERFVK